MWRLVIFLLVFVSCQKTQEKTFVARVNNHYMEKTEISDHIPKDLNAEDSISFINQYINKWANRKLLLDKAKLNLSESQFKSFDKEIESYREDLIINTYVQYVLSGNRKEIDESQILEFYNKNKSNLRLNENIFRLKCLVITDSSLKEKGFKALKSSSESEMRKFVKFNNAVFLSFDNWVNFGRITKKIPVKTKDLKGKFLIKNNAFSIEDATYIYLVKIKDVAKISDNPPISYISPIIMKLLKNKNRINYIKKIEADLLQKAIENKKYEIFKN